MAKNKEYTSKDIRVLSDRDHVRLRVPLYLGSTQPTVYTIPILSNDRLEIRQVEFIPAVYKAVGEIIDNSLDEFAHINIKNKTLTINCMPSTGFYQIGDNGRGVPIDKHETGKYTPEVVFGSLKSGRNFDNEKEIGVIGQNGVGSSCVNVCSTQFDVTVIRDKQKYTQQFTDGALQVSKPKIVSCSSKHTGTTISFQLDDRVFKDISLPSELLTNRANEIALTTPDVTVQFNGTTIKHNGGFKQYIERVVNSYMTDNPDQPIDVFQFNIETDTVNGQFYVIYGMYQQPTEQMFTWVNSSLLFDGGKCNTQFFNALFDKTLEHMEPIAKKMKCNIVRNDIRANMLVLANLRIKNPEYDSQSKTRLTGPDLRKEINDMVTANWKAYVKKFDAILTTIAQNAAIRFHALENHKAQKQQEEKTKAKRVKIEGLLDATGEDRSKCWILITEGDSAKSQISEARDPKTIAAFALTGKINNVWGCTPAQVLKMGKITDLLTAIGLVPGKRAVRSTLRYGRIVIATDSDHDGDDIFTLLSNLFYQFWPELLDPNYPPFLYRLIAPNICLVKGKQRIHMPSRQAYEDGKHKYKGYEVRYYKGLGSMNVEDWEMILSGDTDTLLPVLDDGNLKQTFKLLFDNNSDARKQWLSTINE